MKNLKGLFVFVCFQVLAQIPAPGSARAMDGLKTVPFVDPVRYLGVWYQISHKPQWFEFGRVCACARQKLSQGNNGVVNVYNSCNEDNPAGRLKEIRGIAKNDDRQTNAKYTVDFNFPWKGSYWIIALDPNYQWAVVSDALQSSVYILARTPTLDPQRYQDAFAQAARQLDVSDVKMTYQANCTYPQ